MTKPIDSSKTVGDSKAEEIAANEQLDRAADVLAEEASKAEQDYDEDHNIFTK